MDIEPMNHSEMSIQDRPIGIRQVELMCGYSKPTIMRRIKAGEFPPPRFRDGASTVRWSYLDVASWVESKLGDRKKD